MSTVAATRMMLVATKSKMVRKRKFWERKRPELGMRPGEKQLTLTLLFFDLRRRVSSCVLRKTDKQGSRWVREGKREDASQADGVVRGP